MNAARNWRRGGAGGFCTPPTRIVLPGALLRLLYSAPANKTCSISADSYRSNMIATTPPPAAAFAPLATRAALCLLRRKPRQYASPPPEPPLPPEPAWPPAPPPSSPSLPFLRLASSLAVPTASPPRLVNGDAALNGWRACLCGAFESLILPHLRCLTAVPEKAVLSQMLLICGATAGPATGTKTALGIRAETIANNC